MNDSSDIYWQSVQGFNSSGLEIKEQLDLLLAEDLSYEEQIDLLAELYRDGAASTAGYAAIPILICGMEGNPRATWEMAHTACLILGVAGHNDSPPVSSGLISNISELNQKLAIKAILRSAADSELGVADLVATLAGVLSVLGRYELADVLVELALKEYGVET